MDKYFLFLKKPFSFRGRITRLEYLISILITPIFSIIAGLIMGLLFYGLEVYPKPSSLILAEKEYQVAEVKHYAYYDNEELALRYDEASSHFWNLDDSYRNNLNYFIF